MVRNYIYRVDHDIGFAPHISRTFCTMCGCKSTTIEKDARSGSWVIGIGGNRTGKPNALIYAMRVDETPSYEDFKRKYPAGAKYLSKKLIRRGAPVLLSRRFYYFGNSAPTLPHSLSHIILRAQGRKCVSNDDVRKLERLVLRRFGEGVHGVPNNAPDKIARCKPKTRSCSGPRKKKKRGIC